MKAFELVALSWENLRQHSSYVGHIHRCIGKLNTALYHMKQPTTRFTIHKTGQYTNL